MYSNAKEDYKASMLKNGDYEVRPVSKLYEI